MRSFQNRWKCRCTLRCTHVSWAFFRKKGRKDYTASFFWLFRGRDNYHIYIYGVFWWLSFWSMTKTTQLASFWPAYVWTWCCLSHQKRRRTQMSKNSHEASLANSILLMVQKSGVHQLRLVVYPINYRVLYIPVVVWDFFHQQQFWLHDWMENRFF